MLLNRNGVRIKLTPEEHRQMEEIARRLGYKTPAAFARDVLRKVMRSYPHFSGADALYHGRGTAPLDTEERDPDQAYFWTDEWQAAEREADADIAAGRVETFDTMDEFLADLMDDE